jgi:hypothetical protein
MSQASEYVHTLERINAVGMSIQIIESIPETSDEIRSKVRATYPAKPQERSRGNPSASIGAMDVIVVAAVCVARRSRRRGSRTGYCAQTSSDCGPDTSTMTSARDGADHRPGAGPKKSARNGALARVVRVGVGRRHQQQSRPNHGGNTQSLSHLLPLST